MAHDFDHKKDKIELAKTNPRAQSFGVLSSGDIQYKNYLAGMKPRTKTPENNRTETKTPAANNLRLSADVKGLKEDTDKMKANRSMYTEMSSVPTKKTNDFSFERSKENTKPKPDRLRAKSSSFDEEASRNEATLSVGKLCSMFDGPTTTGNANKPQLRNTNNDVDRRDHLKRYSALEPMQRAKHDEPIQRAKHDEPIQRAKYDDKKVDESNVGNVNKVKDNMTVSNKNSNKNESPDSISSKRTLNIDAMLSLDVKAEIDDNVTAEINSTETTECENIPASKTKGMHGLLQRKGSEFDDFEDRIVPTGTKTIDISSMLAPSSAPSSASSADDNNNHHNENIHETQNEQSETENKQSVSIDFDFQKKRELDRLMQAQEEVKIHKAFNIKRRSLKDKLNEMCSMDQDSFDHGVVPYGSVSQPIEQSPINIHSYVDNQCPTSVTREEDTHDKQCESVNNPIYWESENVSAKDVLAVDTYLTSNGTSKNNTIPIDRLATIVKDNISNIKEESQDGIEVDHYDEGVTESTIGKVVTKDMESVEITQNKDGHNGEISKIDLVKTDSNEMNILLSNPGGSESDNDSEEMTQDKPYESVVERFDAFLTSHGHGIAEIDPDILLPPAPIPPAEVDVTLLTAAILDSYELDTSIVGSNAESNEQSFIDDIEISNDISDNLSVGNEKVSADSEDLSLSNGLPADLSIADEVIDSHPATYYSQDDDLLNMNGKTADLDFEDDSLSTHNDLTENNDISAHVKLKLPSIPTQRKQDKIELASPDMDFQMSYEVEENVLPKNLPIINKADEIFSEESVGVVDMENRDCNKDVGLDNVEKNNILNDCHQDDKNRIIVNSLDTESYVSNIIADTVDSSTIATLTNSKENNLIMENVSLLEATPDESTDVDSSDCMSGQQATLDSSNIIDQVVSSNISTNATVEKQKQSIDQHAKGNVCSRAIDKEGSSTSDNDYQYQVSKSIKSRVHAPKKSNLIKSKKGVTKNVNFKDPSLNDVILTYGPTEYDRANADIDPIASSAEWELEKRVDKMDVFSVDLQKDERGLGLSIIGLGVGTETGVEKLGIFVKTLTENGASQKDGRIQVNDQILEVNGISLVGVTQYFAAQTLKNTDGVVRFLMGREKLRRTQYSPGTALAGNPEMHKHVEEMNKVLQQLEEFEDRAMNAEGTLEDVKVELLKAEERAHEAEQHLKDTKEQLTAATESPFIGTTKKLKHEIKKKGGKHEKLDNLQQSLTEMTNRLSTSEENLTEQQNKNESKDSEIVVLRQKVLDLDNQITQMKNSNKFLHNEIGCRTDQINSAKLENGQLKEQLNEITDKYEKEKENLVCLQIEMAAKTGAEVEEKQNKIKEVESEKKSLMDEIHALTHRLEINEDLLKEVSQTVGEDNHVKHLECKINEYKIEQENSNANIITLKEKNEYLQSLIVKLERREELAPGNIDIEQRFREKEEEYMKQNDNLHERISELENHLEFPRAIVSNNELSPALPIRGYVNIKDITQLPPEISRNTKPCGITEPIAEVEINVNVIDEDKNILSDSGVESINNIDEIDVVLSQTGNDDTVLYNTEYPSLSASPNPVPKPERGNFISVDHNDINMSDDITDEPSELSMYPIQTVYPFVNESGENTGNTQTLQENIYFHGSSMSGITSDYMPVVPSNKNLSKISTALSFDLDDLPEGKIDNESDEDQGQFQLIHEEDIEEEQQTPAPEDRTIRLHSDVTDDRAALNGSLITDSFSSDSFDKWLGRLDSTAREAHSDMIAAQVTAGTPIIRKYSNTSSVSSEGEEIADIAEIDSCYLEKSGQNEITSELSTNETDKAVNGSVIMETDTPDVDVTGDLKKCLSLDIAIPPTPVLENKGALDKKALMNNQRTKPSRSPRVALAAEVTVCEADGSETTSTSALSHHVYKPVAKIKAAQSVPNLSLVPDSDKPSKRKHKYVFYLPKAFKKTKLGKRLSQDSFNKRNKETSPSLSDTDLTPIHLGRTSSDTYMHSYTPSLNMEAAVVPIAEKTASLNQEKANDAATEEAVVPFADKEMLMKRRSSDTDLHVYSSDKSSLSTSPPSPETLNIPATSSPSLSSVRSSSSCGNDDKTKEPSITNPSSVPRSQSSTLEYEFSSYTASPESTFPEVYNERGIDVEMGNGNSEDTSFKTQQVTQWDVKQVGQWLTEIKMPEYANSFKLHNVTGSLLLNADRRELKEYGVHNHEHRSQIKTYIKDFRTRYGKSGWQKIKDHKSTKDKLQFWKGKYKLN